MELSKEEGTKLANAIKAVQAHYPLQVSQKAVDIGMLIYTAGTVYGTRAASIYARKQMEAKTGKPATPPNDGLIVFPGTMAGR